MRQTFYVQEMYKERFDRVQSVCWKYGLGTEQGNMEEENGWRSNGTRRENGLPYPIGIHKRRSETSFSPAETSLMHLQEGRQYSTRRRNTNVYRRMLDTSGRPVETSLMHLQHDTHECHSLLYCWIHKVRLELKI